MVGVMELGNTTLNVRLRKLTLFRNKITCFCTSALDGDNGDARAITVLGLHVLCIQNALLEISWETGIRSASTSVMEEKSEL